ncbi:MAG: cytochrome P450 [Acidobacteriota bacterium]
MKDRADITERAGYPVKKQPATALIDPSIADIINNPGRPSGYPPLAKIPQYIPGKSGVLAGIKSAIEYKQKGLKYFLEQIERHGKIFRDQIGPYPIVVVADREIIGQVLRNEDQLWSTGLAVERVTRGLRLKIDPNKRSRLMALDFEPHRQYRQLVQPAFNMNAMKGYLSIIQKSFEDNLRAWPIKGKIGFKVEARRILSKLASRLFLGIYDANESARIEKASQDYWNAVPVIIKSPLLSSTWKRGLQAIETLSTMMQSLIPIRQVQGGEDLFSQLCQTQKETNCLDDDQLIDLMFGILFAAFDTTALALTSMAYLLARNPQWQTRLREEALLIPEQPSLEDLQTMEQTEWVWKETLRLYPVSANSPRFSLRECKLGQYTIPPATLVFLSIGLLGYDSESWSSPDRFDPERFSPARAENKSPRHLFFPFGHGPHTCIGLQLATLEMKLFWHRLLTRYKFHLAQDYTASHELTPLGCVSGSVDLIVEEIQI